MDFWLMTLMQIIWDLLIRPSVSHLSHYHGSFAPLDYETEPRHLPREKISHMRTPKDQTSLWVV